MSKKHNKPETVAPVDLDQIKEAGVYVAEPADEPVPVQIVTGVVANCARLNIRKAPKKIADVVVEVAANSELVINMEESTRDWYRVCTASGIEGFCMKDFVTIKQ